MSENANIHTGHTDEELIQRLKFTPRTYKIQLWGYGGEYVMGTVEREIYNYFRQRRLSVPDYAWGGEEFDSVPEEMRPFEPGAYYECDSIGHAHGVDKNAGTMQVLDENGTVVYERDLSSLNGCDVQLSTFEEVWIDSQEPGTVVYFGYTSEKGTFFEADLDLTEPFDPEKLLLNLCDFDANEIVIGVEYDDVELDNYGGDTNGKGSDHAFYIAGSNRGSGYERYRDMDDIKYKLTDWFPAKINPVREGKYNVKTQSGHEYHAAWNGEYWYNDWNPEERIEVKRWQGVSYNPDDHFLIEDLDNIRLEFL